MYKIIALLFTFLFTTTAYTQSVANKLEDVYLIPYASSDNQIELRVINTGELPTEDVQVQVSQKPHWLTFIKEEQLLNALEAGEEKQAPFTFTVDRIAPIMESVELKFEIFSNETMIGFKVIRLQVEAPTEAVLSQNYPNPFNPETTISFDLPVEGQIDLRIYDVLGREVALLAKDDRSVGHHRITWDASRFASGTYFYVLKAKGSNGEQVFLTEKMLYLK